VLVILLSASEKRSLTLRGGTKPLFLFLTSFVKPAVAACQFVGILVDGE
jgi:hypothetical protein